MPTLDSADIQRLLLDGLLELDGAIFLRFGHPAGASAAPAAKQWLREIFPGVTPALADAVEPVVQIAFTARLAAGDVDGIFVGPNPATDTVIKEGDALDGSVVTFLRTGQRALNDAGQIAFYAELANGRRGIYVFTPVPEPGLVLAAAGLLGLAGAARPRV